MREILRFNIRGIFLYSESSRFVCWTFLSVVVCYAKRSFHEQFNKRTMARKHTTARGQPDKLQGDERTPRLHGKASQGLGKELHG